MQKRIFCWYHAVMDGKRVSALCASINTVSVRGPDTQITGIAYDSRQVKKGDIYFALPGIHTDGHNFIPQALARGAAGIVCSRLPEHLEELVCYIQVADPRKTLSPLSAAFYDHPSREMKVIGVTGTDGKSTTVFFIYQLLRNLQIPSGFLSTVHYLDDTSVKPNPYRQSTPEAPEIHSILRSMRNHGREVAVLEATSHGLSKKNNRLGDVAFDAAVFTNLTHEHLEFHKTFRQYRKDKANLFRGISSFGVVNKDDKNGKYFSRAGKKTTHTYSMHYSDADLWVKRVDSDEEGSTLVLARGEETLETRLNIPGRFHVEDLLAALLTVMVFTGKSLKDFHNSIPSLSAVPGRMEQIKAGQPFTVIVDYAHTPGSFLNLLPPLKEKAGGKIITLFGSAGERDQEKRKQQGKIASLNSDIIVLTDEDPRGEEEMGILNDIAQGCENKKKGKDLFLIPDRRQAIHTAFSLAGPKDIVLLLGKGHETSILYKDGSVPWSEAETARTVLEEMGYTRTNE